MDNVQQVHETLALNFNLVTLLYNSLKQLKMSGAYSPGVWKLGLERP